MKDRDEAILEHVRRFRLTTEEAIHYAFFESKDPSASRKVVARLTSQNKIQPFPLGGKRLYYVLTRRAALDMGENIDAANPFSPARRNNAYGVLWYCLRYGIKKYTVAEFRALYPTLAISGGRLSNYFFDDSMPETPRLGLIYVDEKKTAEKIVRRMNEIIANAYTLPEFGKLIQDGRFLLSIATPTAGKKASIVEALAQEFSPHNTRVRFRVAVVPELEHVLINTGRSPSATRAEEED